jgi:hypothetical protein
MGLEPFRPVTLRPHLSMSLPFAGWQQIELPDDLTDSG